MEVVELIISIAVILVWRVSRAGNRACTFDVIFVATGANDTKYSVHLFLFFLFYILSLLWPVVILSPRTDENVPVRLCICAKYIITYWIPTLVWINLPLWISFCPSLVTRQIQEIQSHMGRLETTERQSVHCKWSSPFCFSHLCDSSPLTYDVNCS